MKEQIIGTVTNIMADGTILPDARTHPGVLAKYLASKGGLTALPDTAQRIIVDMVRHGQQILEEQEK